MSQKRGSKGSVKRNPGIQRTIAQGLAHDLEAASNPITLATLEKELDEELEEMKKKP